MKEKTILVVDDEQDLRELIELSLQSAGYRTLSAGSGQRAIDLASENEVDAVLSDIRMPEGDGVFLLKHFARHFPKIPVYIMTGFTDYPTEELLELGAKSVLLKPFQLSTMHEKIQEGLGPRPK